MQISIIHDLSPQQLRAGFARGIDGFFFASYWYLNRPKAYDFVRDIALKGGLKKAYGIDDSVMYIHGSDRPVVSSKEKNRVFLRPAIACLREAVCFKPDVIQVMDLPLDDKDGENRICQKLAINRDILMDFHKWLINNGFRSSNCYKSGVPKFSRFMLLGVCHGDYPDAYAEEAKFMMQYCEVVGIPVAGLLSRVKGLSMPQRYDYVKKVVESVLNTVGNSRVVQLMGYGVSRVSAIGDILRLAKKFDATLWMESSTTTRNSTHARKVLSLNIKNSDRLEYVNVAKVKGAEKFSPLDIFRENNKVLKGLLVQAQLFNG